MEPRLKWNKIIVAAKIILVHFIHGSMLELECGPMPNVMAALPNKSGAFCSTPQSLADAQYWRAVQ